MIVDSLVLSLTVAGCTRSPSADQQPATHPTSATAPATAAAGSALVAAVYVDESNRRGGDDVRGQYPLILAAWSDGRIVWSQDLALGGPSYLEARIDPQHIRRALAELDKKGLFTNSALSRTYYGPDSSYTVISISDGRRRIKMSSWHEQFERNSDLVATSSGITSHQGRSRAEIMSEQPVEYREFRQAWSDVRSTLAALIPESGRQLQKLDWKPE